LDTEGIVPGEVMIFIHQRVSRRSAGLVAACGIMLAGCGDWPHFDYAVGPAAQATEIEGDGAEQVQNLYEVHGDVEITGRIDDAGYVPSTSGDAPFGLSGWYSGDIDYFQFTLRDPRDARFSLTWSDPADMLDLYFFTASSSDGQLTLIDHRDKTPSPVVLEQDGLEPGTIYVLGVAGRAGEGVDYHLLLQLGA
jgi:hypothetical protein